jgi:hypothetical protein
VLSMLRLRPLIIATFVAALSASAPRSAAAFQIDPQCSAMEDPARCTCALRYGGTIGYKHFVPHWYYPRQFGVKVDKDEIRDCARRGEETSFESSEPAEEESSRPVKSPRTAQRDATREAIPAYNKIAKRPPTAAPAPPRTFVAEAQTPPRSETRIAPITASANEAGESKVEADPPAPTAQVSDAVYSAAAVQSEVVIASAQAPVVIPTEPAGMTALNRQVANLTAQLDQMTKILAEQQALKNGDAASHPEIDETIYALNVRINATQGQLRTKDEVFSKYLTSIRPNDRNLYMSSRKAAESFPRVPFYFPGTAETGEFWVEPNVNDVGKQVFTLKFVDPESDMDKVRSQIDMSLADIEDVRRGLLQLRKWSKTAHEDKIRKTFEKRITCFPKDDCPPDGETVEGKSSTELQFLIYEDGSTAGRIQRNKGKYVEGFNFSVDSGLLLQAYITHVTTEAKLDFQQGTASKEELDKLFK